MTQQLERDEVEPPALESSDHLADEATLHAVGFDEHQGAFNAHGAQV